LQYFDHVIRKNNSEEKDVILSQMEEKDEEKAVKTVHRSKQKRTVHNAANSRCENAEVNSHYFNVSNNGSFMQIQLPITKNKEE